MIEVGSRVMYTHNNDEYEMELGYFPPFGTCGTVLYVDFADVQVKWDSGTDGDGVWYCDKAYVKEVKE